MAGETYWQYTDNDAGSELGLMRPTYRQRIGRKDGGGSTYLDGITPWGRVYHCNLPDQHIVDGTHAKFCHNAIENNHIACFGFSPGS